MSWLSKFFKYFQALSLDVTFGGVVGCMFVSSYMGVQVDIKTYLVLAATIWLIYTLDHLMDVRSSIDPPITFRHRLHWRNATTMWGAWSFLLIIVFSMLYKLPQSTLLAGSIMGVLVLLYFVSLKLLKNVNIYHKEIVAAIFYAIGIFLPPVSISKEISLGVWLLFVEMFALAYINLLIFSVFERIVDKQEGYHSLVSTLGVESVRGIIWGLISAVSALTAAGYYFLPTPLFANTQFLILGMNLCLALIMLRREFFIKNMRYRVLGDAVFVFPIVYLLFFHGV